MSHVSIMKLHETFPSPTLHSDSIHHHQLRDGLGLRMKRMLAPWVVGLKGALTP
jgi:hypothetical protein